MSKINLPDILQKTNPIDESLASLATEASDFIQELNNASLFVTELEEKLKALHLNFPFRFEMEGEKEQSQYSDPEEHHNAAYSDIAFIFFLKRRFLAWEADDNSKTYRLFTIVEEHEILERVNCRTIFRREIIYKKAFSETPLKTMRLRYIKYLLPFVDAFKRELESHRKNIRQNLQLDLSR